jgi:D-alanyl-D-alanine carboxypeptidase (penicillin-binding protein 5/6)
MESLSGTPFVSCDGWIVMDAADGKVIGGLETDTRLDFASTTKMMTAWLVIRYAESHPEVLDEMLTMSVRADETRGSTSDIRTGESLSIREALYGLMLPSGNDMSVALAEYFGARLPTAAESTGIDADSAAPTDPLDLFVAAMNAEAARLGMTNTHYDNPHGLTAETHLSTVRDLATLARTAIGSDVYRQYCSTLQRGAVVSGPGGYSRNVVWKNTNQLLETEGYDGVKTGTTDRAGACLVSTGVREGRRLIVVVLGSAASESRYTDSRNLYRWGWQQVLETQNPGSSKN